jgi:ribose transport system substrate-binding protein
MSAQDARRGHRRAKALVTTAVCIAGVAVAGCGSSDTTATGTAQGDGSGGGVAAAKTALAPYTGHPTPFPVDTPLTRRPSPDATFVYLQCPTTVCALVGKAMGAAATSLGVKFRVVNSGATAASQQAAMDTIAALKPAAVLIPGIDLTPIGPQIKKLTDANVPVVTVGATGTAQYGVQAAINSDETLQLDGKLLADWAVAAKGPDTKVAFYAVPGLSFSPLVQRSFQAEMDKLCPDCEVRIVDIPVTTLGTTAPSRIVSDLQRHPSTNVLAFPSYEEGSGLAAALDVAGLHPLTVGVSPTPATLQDIKAGRLTAAVGFDIPTTIYTAVDAAARLATDQPLPPAEKTGAIPIQVLTQRDITFDPSQGWTGYPDFAQRYAKLWHADQR